MRNKQNPRAELFGEIWSTWSSVESYWHHDAYFQLKTFPEHCLFISIQFPPAFTQSWFLRALVGSGSWHLLFAFRMERWFVSHSYDFVMSWHLFLAFRMECWFVSHFMIFGIEKIFRAWRWRCWDGGIWNPLDLSTCPNPLALLWELRKYMV